MLIRMNSGVNAAKISFHSKFGASLDEAREIMQRARDHHFQVKGVSFHIGSGGAFSRKDAYQIAIAHAKPLLDAIAQTMHDERPILNVGGGLLHDTDLQDALGWTETLPYQMIAEPGRFFSEPSHHLAIQVIAKTPKGLFLDNGVYSELNCFHRDHWIMPKLTHLVENGECTGVVDHQASAVFGPTCDSYDTLGTCAVPRDIRVGDWILLPNMGAYTNAGAIEFNGIACASSHPPIDRSGAGEWGE